MRYRVRLGVVAGLSALMALSLGSANAAEVPADLEYSYTLDQPVIGNMSLATKGDCTQTLGAPFTLAMTGGVEEGLTKAVATAGNDVTCTLAVQASSTGATVKGTVSASAEGQSGSGAFTLVCDVGRSMESWFRILVGSDAVPALAPDPYGVVSEGYISCSWVIDVSDAQKSQLSGTLEMQGTFSEDSAPVDWSNCAPLGLPIPEHALKRAKCVEFDMNIQAYVTGGTGAYEGRSGSGSMTQVVYAPLIIPISLDSAPPPPPACPPDQPDCVSLDLTGCEYSATDPGDPSWMDLSAFPPGAAIPGFRGPGWYRCGGGGGGGGGEGGLTGCQYSPTEQTGPGWSFIELPPGAQVPGYQGPGWYNCGDAVPPPPAVPGVTFDAQQIRAAFTTMLSSRAGGDMLSLSTKKGALAAPRFVSPARTSKATVRDFATKSTASVRVATVPGAVCTVTAKGGSVAATLVKDAKALRGQVATKMTAAKLLKALKAKVGSQATLAADCSVKSGKRTVRLPAATVTVRFT